MQCEDCVNVRLQSCHSWVGREAPCLRYGGVGSLLLGLETVNLFCGDRGMGRGHVLM